MKEYEFQEVIEYTGSFWSAVGDSILIYVVSSPILVLVAYLLTECIRGILACGTAKKISREVPKKFKSSAGAGGLRFSLGNPTAKYIAIRGFYLILKEGKEKRIEIEPLEENKEDSSSDSAPPRAKAERYIKIAPKENQPISLVLRGKDLSSIDGLVGFRIQYEYADLFGRIRVEDAKIDDPRIVPIKLFLDALAKKIEENQNEGHSGSGKKGIRN